MKTLPADPSAKETAAVARQWQIWAAQNLLRGVVEADICAQLILQGIEATAAQTLLDELRRSPVFEAARPMAIEGRRAAMVLRLRRVLATQGPPESTNEIPRRAGVTAADLREIYLAHNVPVVLTDWIPQWRAFGLWTPTYFRQRFANELVTVTVGRSSDPDYDMNTPAHSRTMPLREYLDLMDSAPGPTNDFYMVAQNRVLAHTALGTLLDDIQLPPELFDSDRAIHSAALWLGPAGTVTPLHHDTSSILLCQMLGRKRIYLAAPDELGLFDDARSLYSGRDPERDDFGDVPLLKVDLLPGEALWIPVGWWHHVRALDTSISLALNHLTVANNHDWYRPGQIR